MSSTATILFSFIFSCAGLANENTERSIFAVTKDLQVNPDAVAPVRLTTVGSQGRVENLALPKLPLSGMQTGSVRVGDIVFEVAISNHDSGLKICVDVNRNNNFRDDPIISMIERTTGRWFAEFVSEDGIPLHFMLTDVESTSLYFFTNQERRGILQMPAGEVAFVLVGSGGQFNTTYDGVYFDLDRDGNISTDAFLSEERFQVDEKLVTIDGVVYEFIVEQDGSSISLVPSNEPAPYRPIVEVGYEAPDVFFVDLNTTEHLLSDFQGEIVVLHSWGSWCVPCKRETPNLIDIDNRFRNLGVRLLGVNIGDSLQQAIDYAKTTKMNWMHTPQARETDMVRWFKLQGLPSIVVIDRDGKIAAMTGLGSDLTGILEQLVDGGTSLAASEITETKGFDEKP